MDKKMAADMKKKGMPGKKMMGKKGGKGCK
jgi:hypothetical protein